MRSFPHFQIIRIFYGALTFVLVALSGCQRPYSPAVYRQQNQSQQFAMICHNDKHTLRVPAEEWEAHKAHGDYRGPCRPTKPAGKLQPKKVRHTAITYDDAKPRSSDSYEQWAEQKAIKDAYLDSLKTVMQQAPAKKQ